MENQNINECLTCDCYDPDMGCTMPSKDMDYACPLEINTVTEFFMAMIPPTTTHQQKQVTVVKGKPIFYEPADLKAARSKLMAHLGKHTPERKLRGPLRLTVKWCFPITGNKKDGQYKDTKPDNGNSNKLLEDCMEDLGYFERGDQQIASLIVEHFWAKLPGIYIKIVELE